MVSAHDRASHNTSRILGAPSLELSTRSFESVFSHSVCNSDIPDTDDTPDPLELSTLLDLGVSVVCYSVTVQTTFGACREYASWGASFAFICAYYTTFRRCCHYEEKQRQNIITSFFCVFLYTFFFLYLSYILIYLYIIYSSYN